MGSETNYIVAMHQKKTSLPERPVAIKVDFCPYFWSTAKTWMEFLVFLPEKCPIWSKLGYGSI